MGRPGREVWRCSWGQSAPAEGPDAVWKHVSFFPACNRIETRTGRALAERRRFEGGRLWPHMLELPARFMCMLGHASCICASLGTLLCIPALTRRSQGSISVLRLAPCLALPARRRNDSWTPSSSTLFVSTTHSPQLPWRPQPGLSISLSLSLVSDGPNVMAVRHAQPACANAMSRIV